MRRVAVKMLLLAAVIMITTVAVCDAQTKGRTKGRNPERSLFNKKRNVKVKETKVREPRAVTKAKRKQEKNQEKLDKDYDNYVEESRKRAYKIQTPDVQSRMKQNEKDIKSRDKDRKKRSAQTTRSGRSKYKK